VVLRRTVVAGHIHMGETAGIGANAVLLSDAFPQDTAAGIPARIAGLATRAAV
jgi:serine acetyltransferase